MGQLAAAAWRTVRRKGRNEWRERESKRDEAPLTDDELQSAGVAVTSGESLTALDREVTPPAPATGPYCPRTVFTTSPVLCCLSVFLSLLLSVCLFDCLSVCLTVYLSSVYSPKHQHTASTHTPAGQVGGGGGAGEAREGEGLRGTMSLIFSQHS